MAKQQKWGVAFGPTATGTTRRCDDVRRYDERRTQRRRAAKTGPGTATWRGALVRSCRRNLGSGRGLTSRLRQSWDAPSEHLGPEDSKGTVCLLRPRAHAHMLGRPAGETISAKLLGRARCRQVGVVGGRECGKWMRCTGETETDHVVLLDCDRGTRAPASGEGPAYHGIYRGLRGRPCGARLALLPDRPARTIVLLVRLTASRST